jgi:hypothetical protein
VTDGDPWCAGGYRKGNGMKNRDKSQEPVETSSKKLDPRELPALFATIHFRSPQRPDGYTDEDIAELNRLANAHLSDRKDEA